jgi:hypothetical protein
LEHDNEAPAIAAFNTFIDQSTIVIRNLNADITRLEADKIMYQASVDDATMRLDYANRREEENTKLWSEKNDINNAYYDQYAAETECRDEERAVYKEAAELLEESFADTSNYVMRKVEHVEYFNPGNKELGKSVISWCVSASDTSWACQRRIEVSLVTMYDHLPFRYVPSVLCIATVHQVITGGLVRH